MNNFQNILNHEYSLQEFKQNILLPVFQHNTSDFKFYKSSIEVELNESETKIAKNITQYGELTTHDGVNINFYEVKLQPNVVIEHNRVTVGSLIRRLLLENAAFVNFVYTQDDKPDWRFSFIFKGSVINQETEEYEDKETEPKRFTYLLGPNESCRTVAENLQRLTDNPEIEIKDIENAFSVEKLSKEFFDNYKKHYELFINHIIINPGILTYFEDNEREKHVRDFVKKMLGRIVFLYFIQKKGWLGASTTEYKDGKQNFMPELFNNSEKDTLFYAHYLEPLFYQTLNKSRDNDICKINNKELGKVPFLNGGLFEPEFKNGRLLRFPPELFKNLFEFFNNYNFTIIENDPLNRNVAVDPEMLGHIFENLLEDNKDKGAFYTPKEIVHYMCQESLIEYLHNKLNAENNRTDIEQFIKHKKENDFIKQNNEHINTALDNLKVCDPAIGSGAFPVGLLMEIYTAKQALQEISENSIKKESPADIKQHIIQNSIYGVDIEKGAVDIARLRFWLSLIIDETEPKPLPNLDYKIVKGNSLISEINGELVNINWDKIYNAPKADEYVKKISNSINALSAKHKEYFSAKNKNKLKIEIRNLKIDILLNQLAYDKESYLNKNQTVADMGLGLKASDHKKNLVIEEKKASFNRAISKLKKLKDNPEQPLGFFNWELDFPEIMNKQLTKQSGFDIVIGNPPYVDIKGMPIKDVKTYFNLFTTTENRINLYSIFIERGVNLLNLNGNLIFINPNSILINKSYKKIRNYIIEGIEKIIKLPDSVFEAATVETIILQTKKISQNKNVEGAFFANNDIIKFDELVFKKFSRDKWKDDSNTMFNIFINEDIDNILSHIEKVNYTLDSFIETSLGITPYDKYKGHSQKLIKERQFHSITKLSKEYVPLISGKNIHKYIVSNKIQEYLKYGDWLGAPRNKKFFTNSKIIVRQIVGKNGEIIAGYSDKPLYFTQIGFSIIQNIKEELELKFLLPILNSKLISFYHLNKFLDKEKKIFQKILIANCKKLPIPVISKQQQQPFVQIVDYIIYLKSQSESLKSHCFEQIIDGMVYELYFEKELKESDSDILQFLQELPEITNKMTSEEKTEIINTVYEELNDALHPVKKRLSRMGSIPEIRIIEGKEVH